MLLMPPYLLHGAAAEIENRRTRETFVDESGVYDAVNAHLPSFLDERIHDFNTSFRHLKYI